MRTKLSKTAKKLELNNQGADSSLAYCITKAASKQTYYTIRFFADRERVSDAFRAYAYFRWVDDTLDTETHSRSERSDFINRQNFLLEDCYRGVSAPDVNNQEKMLVELVKQDTEKNSGLKSYLSNMMTVMAFDAERRGRLISQSELNEYTQLLSIAVTEAMHYFIGHGCYSPQSEARYLAVTAAHITHMLRDTFDDIQAGYFNIPCEVLDANHIAPQEVEEEAYRSWVRNRVQLARTYFKAGREYLNQVENPRCRIAGLAYTARFECVLDSIEREGYLLRAAYPERKGLGAIVQASGSIFSTLFIRQGMQTILEPLPTRQRSPR
jgi:phytoene/squalene synthetase